MLLEAHRIDTEGGDLHRQLMDIQARYQEIIDQLKLTISLDEDFEGIERTLKEDPSLDFAASRGEHLNGKLMANYLGYDFIEPAENIFFDQDGLLDMDKTEKALGKTLEAVERAVIPGFYGCGFDGKVKTFSRGGSDVTGSIVAAVPGISYHKT